jgi:hypothetical protein
MATRALVLLDPPDGRLRPDDLAAALHLSVTDDVVDGEQMIAIGAKGVVERRRAA